MTYSILCFEYVFGKCVCGGRGESSLVVWYASLKKRLKYTLPILEILSNYIMHLPISEILSNYIMHAQINSIGWNIV